MRIFRWILAFSLLIVASYYIWGYTGKDYSKLPVSQAAILLNSYGKDVHKGNVVAIQPYLAAADFCNGQHFYNALSRYFTRVQDSGWLQPNTVVIMPENIGSWLAFAEEKTAVYQEDSLRPAVATIVNSNIFNFIRHLMYTPPDDKIKHAFVYMKSDAMVRIYTSVFSTLAKKYKVTIAAGSIILPQPSLDARGRIRTRKGQLYYASYVFNPQGIIESRPALRRLPEYDSGRARPYDSSQLVQIKIPAGSLSIATTAAGADADVSPRRQRAKVRLFQGGNDRIWNTRWVGPGGFVIPVEAVQAADDTTAVATVVDSTVQAGLLSSQVPRGVNETVLSNGFTGRLWEIFFRNPLVISLNPPQAIGEAMLLKLEAETKQGRIMNCWFR